QGNDAEKIAELWKSLLASVRAEAEGLPAGQRIGLLINTDDSSVNTRCGRNVRELILRDRTRYADRILQLSTDNPTRIPTKHVHVNYVIGGGEKKGYYHIRKCKRGLFYVGQGEGGRFSVDRYVSDSIESEMTHLENVLVLGRPLTETVRSKVFNDYLPRS